MTIGKNEDRLEEIKTLEKALYYRDRDDGHLRIDIDYDSFKFLRKQAERTVKLEQMNVQAADYFQQYEEDYIAKIDRLREALEFYADGQTYTDKQHTSSGELVGTGYLNILSDNGGKARQVLESVRK